ncbi:MAG: Asp23/Gls24 family envelope stress response protein [Ruminiclostridium sp.]|nr:Asp23/Gls24 family envelope stress response protein [Ruminiclostridium sp.]
MIIVHNHLGGIEFTKAFFVSLIADTTMNCFGVSAMNAVTPLERASELIPFLGRMLNVNKGVEVRIKNGAVSIGLHISVMYGVNVSAVTASIKNKITYAVEEQTKLPVEKIDVYIDGLTH